MRTVYFKKMMKHVPLFPLIPLVPIAMMAGALTTAIRALLRVRRLERQIAASAV